MGYIDALLGNISKFIAEGTAYSRLQTINSYGMNIRRDVSIYSRMVVIDVIFDPNHISQNIDDYYALYSGMNVSNLDYLAALPRNSIVAAPVGEIGSQSPMFLIPFFPPNIAMPVKPGEQIWVFFEDETTITKMGYWISRVNDFFHVDDVNHTHPPRLFDPSMLQQTAADENTQPSYEFRNGVVTTNADGERYTLSETAFLPGGDDAFERVLTKTRSSKIIDYESVPRIRKRPADFNLEGSNNQLISLGTDRGSNVVEYTDQGDNVSVDIPESDLRGKSGMIDMVVGRGTTPETSGEIVTNSLEREELGKAISQVSQGEGNPDFKNDRSRVIITQKSGKLIDGRMNSAVDAYVELTKSNNSTIDENEEGVDFSGAAVKSDKIRLIARSDIVLISTNYEVDAEGIIRDIEDIDQLSSITIRPNGDIIIKPGNQGVVKIGGEDADRAILCTSEPTTVTEGGVDHPGSMVSTMGGHVGTGAGQQGTFSSKILVKAG